MSAIAGTLKYIFAKSRRIDLLLSLKAAVASPPANEMDCLKMAWIPIGPYIYIYIMKIINHGILGLTF